MVFPVPPERTTQLIAGVALVALAVWLFVLKPGRRLHQAFSLFLWLRGCLFIVLSLQDLGMRPEDLRVRMALYLYIAIPFAAFYFGHVFRNRFAPIPDVDTPASPRALPWVLLGGALLSLTVYALDHDLVLGTGALFTIVFAIEMLSYLGLAALFLVDADRSDQATDRHALRLVSLGLTLEAAHHASHRAILFHPFPSNPPIYSEPVPATAWVLWLVVIAGTLGLVASRVWRAWKRPDLGERRAAQWHAGLLVLPLATGTLTALLPSDQLPPYVALSGAWGIVFAALLAYAILHHQLFGIELGVKFAIRQSTVAASFIAMFFIASELAQAVLELGTGSAWVGIVASGILVFFMSPLQRLAARISDSAMPGVVDTSAYRQGRQEDLYRALFESSVREGPITEDDRRMLAGLRDRFQMTPTSARLLELEVLHSLGEGEPGPRGGGHEVRMHA